ncbi:MAG: hypothetical protein WAV72_05195 [Bradyrhizobium sp.]
MTRAELGRLAMQGIAERNGVADREWLASILDQAIEVGREEIYKHVERYQVNRVESNPDYWTEYYAMREHMPILIVP